MRVLLISPPFYRVIGFYNRYFPFGITSLGTLLRDLGHTVLVYDADVTEHPINIDYARLPEKYPDYLRSFHQAEHPIWREVTSVIADFQPDLVGISSFTTFAASAFHVAALSKRIAPRCPVVLGGPHATAKDEEAMSVCPELDFAVRGEGEETLVELVDALARRDDGFGGILGLTWRASGRVVRNPPRQRGAEVDRLPFPDRSLLLNEKKYSSEDMGLLMTSRGCPYSCTYCATDIKRVGYRSAEGVIAEIKAVKQRYGTTQFTFKDDSFTVNRKRVVELCEKMIGQRLRVRWECNTRLNLIDEELLKLMKRAGCNFIKVGIESGSERILKGMRKGIALDQVRAAAALLRRSGIHWTGYFMMGVPGETREDVNQTVEFLDEIRPDLALIGVYEPFPGTAMFDEGVKRGLVRPDMSREDFFTVQPNDYYKADPALQTDTMTPGDFQQLEGEVKRVFHDHNKRLGNLLKMGWARAAVYSSEPATLLADMKKYVSYRRAS
jgi:anaerobic magnesium-protoporphyrin IX monomethyl ester cyclase